MRTLFLVLTLTLAVATPSSAKFFSTETLVEYLNSGDCQKNNVARGYLIGVYDSFEGTLYAQHTSLSEDTLAEIFSDYVRNAPREREFSAQAVVMRAIEAHFKKVAEMEATHQQ